MLTNDNIARRGCWSSSEDQQLYDNVKKYGTDWNKVCQDMSRTLHGCRNRWHILTGKKTRNNRNKNEQQITIEKGNINSSYRKIWYPDEEKKLYDAIQVFGTKNKWNKIAEYINTGRSPDGCHKRWVENNKYYRTTSIHNDNDNDNNNYDIVPINNGSRFNLSNRDIVFENNNDISPTNTPTATTNSTTATSYGFNNNNDVNKNTNNNNSYLKRNNVNNDCTINFNKTVSTLKRGTTMAVTPNVTTIYEFMDRIKIITTTNWTISDIYQLMITMSHIDKYNDDMYFTNIFDWNDIGMKINKNCYDCENVWKLVKNELSENVVGEIMKHNWKTTGF